MIVPLLVSYSPVANHWRQRIGHEATKPAYYSSGPMLGTVFNLPTINAFNLLCRYRKLTPALHVTHHSAADCPFQTCFRDKPCASRVPDSPLCAQSIEDLRGFRHNTLAANSLRCCARQQATRVPCIVTTLAL